MWGMYRADCHRDELVGLRSLRMRSRAFNRNGNVKSLAQKVILVLFVTLLVACAFDGPDAHASLSSSSHEGNTFCCVLHSLVAQVVPPYQLVSNVSSDEPVGLLPEDCPPWILVRSIDHPPERPV